MNRETFETMMRVQLKRKQQATAHGNWRVAEEAIKEIERLKNIASSEKVDCKEHSS